MEHTDKAGPDMQTTKAIVIGLDAAILQFLANLVSHETFMGTSKRDIASIIERLTQVRDYYSQQVENAKR